MLTYEYGYIDRDVFDRNPRALDTGIVHGVYETERAAIDTAYESGMIEFAAVRRIGSKGPWIGAVVPLPANEMWRALWGEIPGTPAPTEYTGLEVVR